MRKAELVRFFSGVRDVSDTHVHADFTDGQDSILAMAQTAAKNGLQNLCFTEHVRTELTYDFSQYVSEIRVLSFDSLALFAGCEAKILDKSGNIDVSLEVIEQADLLVASFHGEQFEKNDFLEAAFAAFENPHVDVWGHPFSVDVGLSKGDWEECCRVAKKNNTAIEINERYPTPDLFLDILESSGALYLKCSDAHKTAAIRNPGP